MWKYAVCDAKSFEVALICRKFTENLTPHSRLPPPAHPCTPPRLGMLVSRLGAGTVRARAGACAGACASARGERLARLTLLSPASGWRAERFYRLNHGLGGTWCAWHNALRRAQRAADAASAFIAWRAAGAPSAFIARGPARCGVARTSRIGTGQRRAVATAIRRMKGLHRAPD